MVQTTDIYLIYINQQCYVHFYNVEKNVLKACDTLYKKYREKNYHISEYFCKILRTSLFRRYKDGPAQPKISGLCLDVNSGIIESAVFNRWYLFEFVLQNSSLFLISELKTLEWWISRLMLDPLFFLLSRLTNLLLRVLVF